MYFIYTDHVTDNPTSSNVTGAIVELFKEPITITNAYSRLIGQLNGILKDCDLSTLKAALVHQALTPEGVKLKRP